VSLLNLLTLGHIGEIADRTVQPQSHWREDVFLPSCRRNGLGGEFLCNLRSHLLLEAPNSGELGTEVRTASTSRRQVSGSSAT
jgi:hypothetical protein